MTNKVDVSSNAEEFDQAVVSVMREYDDRLDANESYQGLCLVLPRILTGIVSHLRGRKSDEDIRKIFTEIIDRILAGDMSANLLH